MSAPEKKIMTRNMKPMTMTVPVSPWARVTSAGMPNRKLILTNSRNVPIGFSLLESSLASISSIDSFANSQGWMVRPQPTFSHALMPETAVAAASVTTSSARTA